MHITVFCPHCQSRYQLDPSLRGKRMRCPNTVCRTVFEVREEGNVTPALLTPKPPSIGSIGEVVPALRAQSVENDLSVSSETAARLPEQASVSSPGAERAPESPPVSEAVWEPLQEAPPIRGDASRQVQQKPGPAEPATLRDAVIPKPVSPRHRARRLIIAMLVILSAVLGGGILLVRDRGETNEAERFQKAQEFYQNQDFEEATTAFQRLVRDFPGSKNRHQYDFLVEMSAVREAVYAPRERAEDRAGALDRVLLFLEINKNEPLLKEYHGDVWHTLQRLTRELTTLAEQKYEMVYLTQARRSWAEAAKFTPPAGARANETAQELDADFTRVAGLLATRAARLALLKELRELTARGSADAVRAGRARAKVANLEHDPEVVPLLVELVKSHRAKVVFQEALNFTQTPRPAPDPQDDLPSFYIAPRIGNAYAASQDGGVVLALARGVLYALDGVQGDVRWVRRVGVDTGALPLRVPASPFLPELILVVSSDSKSVSAVAADTGTVVWQHALKGVCLGTPVLVDRRLLVPTLSGEVEELETAGGTLQGSYFLGQPLVVGGVHQPGTTLVYFPADSYSVYVLDVAKRACAGILYTGHAPGSLRGAPLVWNETRPGTNIVKGAGWLLMSTSSGADDVEMVPYALPIQQPDQKPAELVVKVKGDAGASPWYDAGKLALATDAGVLALYGIRQPGNRDPLLFRLLANDYRLESEDRARRGRALVVHADASNCWVLTGGKLHRLEMTFTAAAGPGLVARWPQPLNIGSPLHAGQVRDGDDGTRTLILVTQETYGPTCWVRAVEAEHGKVLWQRQLGMVCQDQPVAAADRVLTTDARGLLIFSMSPPTSAPGKDKAVPAPSWQAMETFVEYTGARTGHWTFARDTDFVHLTWGPELTLRIRTVGKEGVVATQATSLPALPLGTPALGSDFVLLPLANGVVLRVSLADGSVAGGPDWRGVGVDETKPGYVAALGNNDFAVTDGDRSVTRIHWADAKAWEKVSTTEMPQRITAPPAILGTRLLVADVSASLTLLEGERLVPGRQWSLGGKITAGPFVRGPYVGLVVGKNRLVWLDPGQDQPAWEYTFVAPIVGQPELVDDFLVVADLQGGITALDPATGTPAGPGYRLKANEAPTAAPVAFGPGNVFLPLMDGTAMVLPMSKLR